MLLGLALYWPDCVWVCEMVVFRLSALLKSKTCSRIAIAVATGALGGRDGGSGSRRDSS